MILLSYQCSQHRSPAWNSSWRVDPDDDFTVVNYASFHKSRRSFSYVTSNTFDYVTQKVFGVETSPSSMLYIYAFMYHSQRDTSVKCSRRNFDFSTRCMTQPTICTRQEVAAAHMLLTYVQHRHYLWAAPTLLMCSTDLTYVQHRPAVCVKLGSCVDLWAVQA